MNNKPDQFGEKFAKAQSLHKRGMFQEAELVYRELLTGPVPEKPILRALTELYLQTKREGDAAACLEKLTLIAPDTLTYYEMLVNLYNRMRDGDKAISCYRRLLRRHPKLANTHYNLGYLLKQYHYYEEALAAYRDALNCGIERPEEVYLNMAVIYSDHLRQEQKAKESLEVALSLNPEYIAALFNLANIYEEEGNKKTAQALFEKIIDQDPSYYPALARLGDVKIFDDPEDPLIQKMKRAVQEKNVDISTRTNLYFALGKALNDCGAYDDAFGHYQKANQCNKQTVSDYDRAGQERMTNDLMRVFSQEWFDKIEPISDASPIFICGMFRSGSTLTEQILASHPMVTAGGEVDFFVRKIQSHFAQYPASVLGSNPEIFKNLADDYISHLGKTFPDAAHITDKRPDNYLHLGLLKSLFPKTRIIYTSRNPLDNCLSVFFLRLGNAMNYATDLGNTAHYLKQCRHLMDHWKQMFGRNIFEVNYDDLVRDPRPVIENMLEFCGLDWSDNCLEFHRLDNIVKTASVWQVRQPLYQKSSGRWRNHEKQLASVKNKLFVEGLITEDGTAP